MAWIDSLTNFGTRVTQVPVAAGAATTLLDAVGETGAGIAATPAALNRVFSCVISNTATCKLQGSVDNATWHDLYTFTATGAVTTAEPWPYVRGNVTAFTSGTVSLKMAT